MGRIYNGGIPLLGMKKKYDIFSEAAFFFTSIIFAYHKKLK